MKRILLFLILMGVAIVGVSKPGPTGIEEPLPIEIKPVLVDTAKLWQIRNDSGFQNIAYYQRVKMPDGTAQELKSRTVLTAEQWKVKAQTLWDAQLAAELNKPRTCTRCGGSGVEP